MNDGKELVDVLKNATEKERAKVARRLAGVIKDLVFANAHIKAEEMIRKLYTLNISPDGTLTMNYTISLNGDVVRLLLAGIRRKK